MNAVHVESVNLTGGPLDKGIGYTLPDQPVFEFITGDRTHTYVRIGATRNFLHAGIRLNEHGDNGLEVASTSMFQDSDSLVSRIASIRWVHKLRSLMG